MHKIYFLTVGVLVAVFSVAQSPITLTSANFPSSNDTLRYTNAQLSSVGNYTQTGANYNWNFSGLIPTSQGRRDYKQALLTPYPFFFFGTNEYGEKIADTLGAGPLIITNYYNYYKKQTTPTNAYIADGSGITFSSIPVPNYFSDKDELYVFPLTYPKYDSTTFKFSTPTTTLLPIRYSKTGYRVTKVDGWGSITTPYGTQNCLRIVTTQYSKDTIKNSFIPIPVGFPNYARSYQWLTATSKIPFLEINGSLIGSNFTPIQVRYRDNYQNTTAGIRETTDLSAIEFYPNPGQDKLWLNFTRNGEFLVEIIDLSGKQLKSESVKSDRFKSFIEISDLSPAVYLIKLTENQKTYFYKFIKE